MEEQPYSLCLFAGILHQRCTYLQAEKNIQRHWNTFQCDISFVHTVRVLIMTFWPLFPSVFSSPAALQVVLRKRGYQGVTKAIPSSVTSYGPGELLE